MSFAEIIDCITEFYKKYSAKDIAESLFVANLWPPNMISHIQHNLFALIFCTLPPEHFSKVDDITSYNDFTRFCNDLYALPLSLPMMEDYRPIPDWGEVKIQIGRKTLKFFYGNIGDMYDYIKSYQLVYSGIQKDVDNLVGRNPINELGQMIRFQDHIINSIRNTTSNKHYNSLGLGSKEVASQEFWQQSLSLLASMDIKTSFDNELLTAITVKLGSISNKGLLSEQAFSNLVMRNLAIPAYFVKYGDTITPIMPRLGLEVLLTMWQNMFKRISSSLPKDMLHKYLTVATSRFIGDRILVRNNIGLACAVDHADNTLHNAVFTNAIVSDDRIMLPYIILPDIIADERLMVRAKDLHVISDVAKLFEVKPITIASYEQKGNIILNEKDGTPTQKITPILVLSHISVSPLLLEVPEDPPGIMIPLTDFLAIVDELKDTNELSRFISFLEDPDNKFIAPNMLDCFAAFRDSHEIIIEGARKPSMIWLDPNWGVRYRHESLTKFWKTYPKTEIKLIDDYRSMAIDKHKTYTRIYQRSHPMFNFILINIGNGWVSSPIEEQTNDDDRQISCSLMECIGDYLNRLKFVTSHNFFKRFSGFHIHIFPKRMVEESASQFKHLSHLIPANGTLWKSDNGFPEPDKPGVRIVVDVDEYVNVSSKETTNTIEVDLIEGIVKQVDKILHDKNFGNIIERLEQIKGGKPRFPIIITPKDISYPAHSVPLLLSTHDHKASRKRVAKLANVQGLKPGRYKDKEAQQVLNELRDIVIAELNHEILSYNYEKSMPEILAILEAYIFDYNRKKYMATKSIMHNVDFDRNQVLSQDEDEFKTNARNIKYLIEKMVQLKPSGKDIFAEKDIRASLALIDKLYEVYGASDAVQYDLGLSGAKISADFVVSVSYGKDFQRKQNTYSAKMAKLKVGEIGNVADALNIYEPNSSKVYIDELDVAFYQDYGFSITTLCGVLDILSRWAELNKFEEATSYTATKDKIIDTCMSSLLPSHRDRGVVGLALEFIVLDDVLRIEGQKDPALDIPVWEYTKRHNRYNIKPVIRIGDNYYWGPNSTHTAAGIWIDSALHRTTPSNIGGVNTKAFIEHEYKKLNDALENKAEEICKRYTANVVKNLKYGKTHPQNIGEYDMIALLHNGILLNIECKDIKPPFCYKDAKRVRDNIYLDTGHLSKVEAREDYLCTHISEFSNYLKWNIPSNTKVISVFVTRYTYWWTEYPPRPTDVVFAQIELLDGLIKNISSVIQ